jgi:hypothetical protein
MVEVARFFSLGTTRFLGRDTQKCGDPAVQERVGQQEAGGYEA